MRVMKSHFVVDLSDGQIVVSHFLVERENLASFNVSQSKTQRKPEDFSSSHRAWLCRTSSHEHPFFIVMVSMTANNLIGIKQPFFGCSVVRLFSSGRTELKNVILTVGLSL